MENVQRAVMLLKPDTHITGQWQGGATLRLNAIAGGVGLSLQGTTNLGSDCSLMLFLQDGSPVAAGELNGTAFQTKVSGVQIKDIAGAAVICGGRFILRSSGMNWSRVIARYRFAHARPTAPAEPQPAEPQPAEPQSVEPQRVEPQSVEPQSVEPQPAEIENVSGVDTETPVAVETMPQEPPAETMPEISDSPSEMAPVPPQNSEAQQQPLPEPEERCPGGIRQSPVDPFPGVFPGSEWVKISYPGPTGWWHYIFGRACVDGYDADVVGVPGDYSMAPPAWLDGFSTYVRCSSGDARGYWLMFQDAQTGRVLDTNRFRHGG
jgi:hypothetical protein